ncbi:MAG: hypothetical protein Q9197_004225 [Variospora fuerteventurae]
MTDDPGEVDDERVIELATISAIYPELMIDNCSPFSATIGIPVDSVKPLAVRFSSLTHSGLPANLPTPPDSDRSSKTVSDGSAMIKAPSQAAETLHKVHDLSHLPPVTLHIRLPPGYPEDKPAELSISAEVPWLSQDVIKRLEKDGHRIWEGMGRSQVLFAYIDHLREAAEDGFSLGASSAEPLHISSELEIMLLDFDIKAKRAEFGKATFECGKGTICHQISHCGHVFCVECLQDFYNNCIAEGDVGNVKCVAPRCGQDTSHWRKRDKTLGPSELLQIPLQQAMVQRFIKLKRKNALESDRNTVYCPRQWCQGPARSKKTEALDRGVDGESDEEGQGGPTQEVVRSPDESVPPAQRLAICTECTFAFCQVCKASWHGEFYICDPKRKAQLTDEEIASEEYLKSHTSPCPQCNARCQKTHGCNHMICYKCSSHFCYLCSSWLDSRNPYQHYNDPKKACHMRLWELEAGDGDDVGRGFAGGIDDVDHAFDGQDDIPLDDFHDVDNEDEYLIELPRAHHAPPLHPPPDVRAAIARRAAAALDRGNEFGRPVALLEPEPANLRAFRPPPGLVRRRPLDGLQRFLDLARNDEEDDWDSDDLDDEIEEGEDFWQIPVR